MTDIDAIEARDAAAFSDSRVRNQAMRDRHILLAALRAAEDKNARLVQWIVDVVGWPMDVAWPNDPPPPVSPRMVAEAWSRNPDGDPDVDDGEGYMARWGAPTEPEAEHGR